MKYKKHFWNSFFLVFCAFHSHARMPQLEEVINQFLNWAAEHQAIYKTNIVLGVALNCQPPTPYRLGYHPALGYYSYRPKQWQELDDYMRFCLLEDPRLPHFIKQYYMTYAGEPAPQPASQHASQEHLQEIRRTTLSTPQPPAQLNPDSQMQQVSVTQDNPPKKPSEPPPAIKPVKNPATETVNTVVTPSLQNRTPQNPPPRKPSNPPHPASKPTDPEEDEMEGPYIQLKPGMYLVKPHLLQQGKPLEFLEIP